jgi:hypothetical protein
MILFSNMAATATAPVLGITTQLKGESNVDAIRVVTTPERVTMRTLPLSPSTTANRSPDGNIETPVGLLKLARIPVPSNLAALPLPASVVTTPPGYETMRMRLLLLSVTITAPVEGTIATLNGL